VLLKTEEKYCIRNRRSTHCAARIPESASEPTPRRDRCIAAAESWIA
jgi:hypothetical protein